MKKLVCHDCGKTLEKGSEYVLYEVVSDKFIKCKECYKKDPVLKNFKKAEVYSRVVGYIRPVEQWNGAKQAEFGDRKEYCVGCAPKKKTMKKIAKRKGEK
ncbi:MAG: anaerobic ribonucleoside-triphosphate reductase [Parcubacteria group bacterium]|jgi:anaerobic ribonucleoside-triphosphate reductase